VPSVQELDLVIPGFMVHLIHVFSLLPNVTFSV